jgi:hypothetical protein
VRRDIGFLDDFFDVDCGFVFLVWLDVLCMVHGESFDKKGGGNRLLANRRGGLGAD